MTVTAQAFASEQVWEEFLPWRARFYLLPRWEEMGVPALYGLSITERLGQVSDGTATCVPRSLYPIPGRTVLVLERAERLQTVGVVWRFDRPSRGLSFKSWESWLQRRLIRRPEFETPWFDQVSDSWRFSGVDQLEIARTLVRHAQEREGGNLWIDLGEESSGIPRDRTYEAQGRAEIWQRLSELAAVQTGFEQRLRPYWSGDESQPIRFRYETGFPRLGRTAAETGWVLEWQQGFPGNTISDWEWPGDASGMTNVADVLGDQVVGTASAPDDWGRWPRMERSWSHTSVGSQDTVDGHAGAYLDANRRMPEEPSFTLRSNLSEIPEPGDHVRVRLTGDDFPAPEPGVPGLDRVWRVVERTITPPNRGAPEVVKLATQEPENAEELPWES